MYQLYLEYEYWIAASQLALAMLGMGATLRGRDFTELARNPKAVVMGLVLQIAGVPLVAWGFLVLFKLDAGVAIGLALCAAIPGGTVSNVFTFIGRGRVALSIALTGFTTLACLITTPLVLGLMIEQYMPADFTMPAGRIAREILLLLLLPLVSGMALLALWPHRAAVTSNVCIRASLALIGVIAVGAIGSGRVDLELFGVYNLAVVLLFLVLLLAFSAAIPPLFGISRADSTAINMEVVVRNSSLGVMIAASMFPATNMASDPVGANVMFTVLIYGGAGILTGIALSQIYARINRIDREALALTDTSGDLPPPRGLAPTTPRRLQQLLQRLK